MGDTARVANRLAGIDPLAVRVQLERIIASAPFRNSKRYPALLRYVVEHELGSASSDLKERTIGIDVFGREPSYDPGADPVVRVSAGEVRKRLAQYYQKADPGQLRIDLPVGSYHPEFTVPIPAPTPASATPVVAGSRPAKARKWLLTGLAAIAAIAVFAFYFFSTRQTALDLFWQPVIAQGQSVLLCLGRGDVHHENASIARDPNQVYVVWWDAQTFARLAGLIQAKGASLRLVREDEATFNDFQQRPAVLIGAFNDQWTLELMSKMRFTFQRKNSVQWIADRDRPAFQDWKVDLAKTDGQGNLAIKQDYAVISRVANPRTGFITVTVAGLWGYGTLAAGRFLTEPKYFEEYAKKQGIKTDRANMQIVIGTEVIQGKSGPPTVLAATSW
jgi:hypothetical protein